MALQVTNRKAAQALRGQGVRVTLDSSETINKLPLINDGDRCATVTSGVFGTIQRVDRYGNSFLVVPNTMAANFASTTPAGYLANGELINIV